MGCLSRLVSERWAPTNPSVKNFIIIEQDENYICLHETTIFNGEINCFCFYFGVFVF